MRVRADQRWRGSLQAGARRRAFTLLEAVLTIALTIVLMAGVFAFYMHILRARETAVLAMQDAKLHRAILVQMAHEIRQATPIVPGDGIGFRGDRHQISIVYLALPDRTAFWEFSPGVDLPPPAQSDWRRVTYQLLWDAEGVDADGMPICHGLWRTHQRMFDPNPQFVVADDDVGTGSGDEEAVTPQADGELFAPEIKYLSFEYFDGAEWRDRWQFAADEADDTGLGEYDGQGLEDFGDDPRVPPPSGGQVPDENSYALPQAVRITIGRVPVEPEDERMGFGLFDDERDELREHHPDRFTIVVPLLTADRTLLSSRQYGVSDSISRQEGGMR